jgi:hypothetical protein
VFASLLPGIRELRTPLAAGYFYLLSLFLIVGGRIPTKPAAGDPLKLFYDAVEWMGKPAALAASTFVAYLVGSVLEVRATFVTRRLWQAFELRSRLQIQWHTHRKERKGELYGWASLSRSLAHTLGEMHRWEMTRSGADAIHRYVRDRIGESEDDGGWRIFDATSRLVTDLPQLRTRLYGADKDLYGDYDRLAAEADLKVNVGLAAIVLSCVAAVLIEPWWALLSGPMVILFFRGLSTVRQAHDVLVQAIVTDVVNSPKFEDYIITELGGRRTNGRENNGYR